MNGVATEVRSPRDEDELRAVWMMLSRAFGWEAGNFDTFVAGSPIERVLAVFVDDEPVACSRIREFGQFFGRRRVPMGGFSPVGVAAEHRGRGYGSLVTEAQFPLLRDRGEVLAGLYPATNSLYRKVGFDVAGVWAKHRVRTRDLQLVPAARGVTTRRATEDDYGAIEACYTRVAREIPGFLDRSGPWWDRIFTAEGQQIYVVDGDAGEVVGYVRYKLQWPPRASVATIDVAELTADDPDVGHALWRLVGSSSSIAPEATLIGPPEHTLLFSLPEQDLLAHEHWRWMARVIDAPDAIAARGYPPDSRTDINLRLIDPQCEWNDGHWRFVLEDGEATLERGGNGDVELGIGAFSALYTGYASTHTLRSTGRLRSDAPGALARLDAAFGGPIPWMPDFY
ncbi:MAG: family N-acetyltransferase [Actinomycetia bacterium]|nr:family N-acetyltransferase [Actinomycetes bacterium]